MRLELTDEILAALPGLMAEFPSGAAIATLCERLAASSVNVRAAVKLLDETGRAVRYRFGLTHCLIPNGYEPNGLRVCAVCRALFQPPKKSARRTCSRFCHGSLGWKRPDTREQRLAAMRAERATPKARARLADHNARRWSDPEQHKKLSEWNRKRWADPVTKLMLSAAIQAVQGTPEMRKLYSDLRKDWWKDPEMRRKMIVAMKAAKSTPEARAKFSELLRSRWADPEKRKIYLAGVQKTAAKMAERNKGRKQSEETIRKRVASTKVTKAAAAEAAA